MNTAAQELFCIVVEERFDSFALEPSYKLVLGHYGIVDEERFYIAVSELAYIVALEHFYRTVWEHFDIFVLGHFGIVVSEHCYIAVVVRYVIWCYIFALELFDTFASKRCCKRSLVHFCNFAWVHFYILVVVRCGIAVLVHFDNFVEEHFYIVALEHFDNFALVHFCIVALQHFGIVDGERWCTFDGGLICNFDVELIDTFDGEQIDSFVSVPVDIVAWELGDLQDYTFVSVHCYKIALELFGNAALVQIDTSSAEPAYIDS